MELGVVYTYMDPCIFNIRVIFLSEGSESVAIIEHFDEKTCFWVRPEHMANVLRTIKEIEVPAQVIGFEFIELVKLAVEGARENDERFTDELVQSANELKAQLNLE